ncbi:lauroyl acyltransferase [Mucilaginibacter sp. PPCGB 2223]|nr:lauroyl acyltransferase [Mucilaginibacter sp. PPCGB 2223]
MIKKAFSILLLGLLYLISLLPFWLLYLISDVIFLLLYYVAKYRRKVVADNLRNAFPKKTPAERDRIEKQYFKYLADLLVESVKLLTISQAAVAKRITISNKEIITNAFANGKSVIGVLGHYGNWELGALRFSLLFDEPRVIVYKPLNNKFFDSVFTNMRSRFGATLVSMRQTMRKLVELKNKRSITVMVGDQTPGGPEVNYFTSFLNQPTAVFLGVEKLAKLTDSVVVFCDVRVTKRGHYHCNFVQLFDQPKQTAEHEITDTHVQYLEQVIRQQPQYWLWSHRRWKHKPA